MTDQPPSCAIRVLLFGVHRFVTPSLPSKSRRPTPAQRPMPTQTALFSAASKAAQPHHQSYVGYPVQPPGLPTRKATFERPRHPLTAPRNHNHASLHYHLPQTQPQPGLPPENRLRFPLSFSPKYTCYVQQMRPPKRLNALSCTDRQPHKTIGDQQQPARPNCSAQVISYLALRPPGRYRSAL